MSHRNLFGKSLLAAGVLSVAFAGGVSAQKIILPDSEMSDKERETYDARVEHFEMERLRRHPLFLQSAKMATEKLGAEIMKGNVNYAINNMYPRWKAFQCKRLKGGEDEFVKKAQNAFKMMKKDGTVITDFRVGQPQKLIYVNMQKKPNLPKVYYPVDFHFQTLVVVPTTTIVQFAKIDEKTGKPTKVVKNSSQIAIYDEVTKKWSFIDSSGVSPNELRNLFPTMPLKFATDLPKSGKVLNK